MPKPGLHDLHRGARANKDAGEVVAEVAQAYTAFANGGNLATPRPIKRITNSDGISIIETRAETQVIPMGPVASQEAIKMLGTNGGGYFNANSAHPFENPTALSNFAQMIAILLIPAALCFAFGRMVGDPRQLSAVGPQSVISSGPDGYPCRCRKRAIGRATFHAPVER